MSRRIPSASAACALLVLAAGCVERNLVADGMVLTAVPADRPPAPADPEYHTALQITWLGTACYLIRVGDTAVFTDPFVTRHSVVRVGLGTLESDSALVARLAADLPVPDAVLVTHGHYDHLLDAAEFLRQPGWGSVPVFGNATTANILAGYGLPDLRMCTLNPRQGAQRVDAHLRVTALPAEHANQLPGFPVLYPGEVAEPRTTPPTRADDFQMGDCRWYLIEIGSPALAEPYRLLFAAGAADGNPRHYPEGPVDAALLCVASWKFAPGYPQGLIRMAKPRNIVLAHFDNFFQVNGAEREVVPWAYLDEFLVTAQKAADHPGFERILMPAVGSTVVIRRPAAAARR